MLRENTVIMKNFESEFLTEKHVSRSHRAKFSSLFLLLYIDYFKGQDFMQINSCILLCIHLMLTKLKINIVRGIPYHQ